MTGWLAGGVIILALAVLAFVVARWLRQGAEAEEKAKTLEATNDKQKAMLDAAANRPRDRDDLAERLRRAGL